MQPIDQTSTENTWSDSVERGITFTSYWPFHTVCSHHALMKRWPTTRAKSLANAHLNASMISGARYHRVATYSVILSSLSGEASNPLLRPKSHIFSSQSAFTNRFPGLRSLWTTDAVEITRNF